MERLKNKFVLTIETGENRMTTMRVFIDDELTKEEEVYPAGNWDEIPDNVREKIFQKHGDMLVDYGWWESVYDDAESIGLKIKYFDIDGGRISGYLMYDAFITKKLILANHGKSCGTYQTVKRYDLRRKDFSESEFEHELLQDYLTILRKEYEHLTSEEAIVEMFQANEYIFDKWGNIV